MTAKSPAASSGQPVPQEFIVKRDGDRPLSFSGFCLADASMPSRYLDGIYRGAVYKTVGGKFITRMSRTEGGGVAMMMTLSAATRFDELIDEEAPTDKPRQRTGVFDKAGVFDTLEAALGWFRPGRLTDDIRKQLGLDEPVRID
jgi:hypothetical protein